MAFALTSASSATSILSIHVLGRFELRLDGQPVELTSRKARALLGYLILNESCEDMRERIVAFLWSTSDSERARGSLRQCLREIRTALPESQFDGFHADRLSITLDRTRLEVDLWTVLAEARAGRAPARLLETPGLIEDMLTDLDSVDPEFSSWLSAKREALQNRLLRELEEALRSAVLEADEGVRLAHAILNLDPTHEEAARLLMRTLAARGDPSGAQRIYHKLWKLLEEHYDSYPDQKTQTLIAQIKSSIPSDDGPKQAAQRAVVKDAVVPLKLPGGTPSVANAANMPILLAVPPMQPTRPAKVDGVRIVLSISPFAMTGPDGSPAYLLQGFRRELIASLVRFREWVVREPIGVPVPSPSNIDEYILEADGNYVGDNIRLSLTLKEAATSDFLWSEMLDLNVESILANQRNIIRRIAAALNVHVSNGRLASIAPDANENLRAFDIWLRGQVHMMSFDPHLWQKADALFRSIIDRYENFGPAYSSLAQLQNTIHFVHPGVFRSKGRTEEALKYGRTAIRLDPNDSRAQLSVGWAHAMCNQHDRAAAHHTLASELNESDPWTLTSCALGSAFRGDRTKAIRLADSALAHSFTPLPAHWRYQAMIRYLCEDYHGCLDASSQAEKSIANVFVWKAAALNHLGRRSEAKQAASRFFSAISGRWFNQQAATPEAMTRWFLDAFPIAEKESWERLRTDFSGAGAPTDGIRFDEWQMA